MAQHDYVIDNQLFPAFRTDLNNALSAIVSNNSGGSDPSTTFANMFYYDTGDNKLKIRNEDNDAFIDLLELDQSNDTVEYFLSDKVRTTEVAFTDGDTALTIADGGTVTTSGNLIIGGNNNELRFTEGANHVGFEAPALSENTIFVLPASDGSANQALVTDGSKNLSFASAGQTLRPNTKPLIINGNMAVSQRGTSLSGQTGTGYQIDRFGFQMDTFGTWTMSQDTSVPTGEGFANSLKWDCTTADSSLGAGHFGLARYLFEGQDLQLLKKGTSNSEKLTLKFYTRSNKTGTYTVEFFDVDNSRQISKTYTIDSANTWEEKIINVPADTTGALNNDNGSSFTIHWWLGAGSTYNGGTLNSSSWATVTNANRVSSSNVNLADSTSNEWFLTGVQLEIGEFTSATIPSFQYEDFKTNIDRCTRYYQISKSPNNTGVGQGFSSDGTGRGATFVPFFPMRTTPTITTSAVSTFKFQQGVTTSGAGTGFIVKSMQNNGSNYNELYGTGKFFVHLDISASGLAQDGRFCRGVANGDAFVECDAELS